MARVTAPTPTELAAHQWEAYERGWQDRIRESDRRQREEMQERIRRDEQRLAELKARQRGNVKAFRVAETLVEIALDSLTPAERSRVFERLTAIGKPLDASLAAAFANEEIVRRRPQPLEQSSGPEINRRDALKMSRKVMRRNKNKIVNRFDLGRVPVTNIEVAKPETLRELAVREERERQEAPIRAAENQLKTTLHQMTDEYRKVWSLPVEKLRRADRDYLDAS